MTCVPRSASVLTPRGRLHLDAAGLVFGARGRVFGRDTLTEPGALTGPLRFRPAVLAAVWPGLRPGLPPGNANRKMLRCTINHYFENRPELYGSS